MMQHSRFWAGHQWNMRVESKRKGDSDIVTSAVAAPVEGWVVVEGGAVADGMTGGEAGTVLFDLELVDLCGCVWLSVVVCGSVWLCVDLCGCVWICVVVCESVWLCVVVCRSVWLCVVVCGCVWLCMVVCGSVWLCVVVSKEKSRLWKTCVFRLVFQCSRNVSGCQWTW